MIVRELELDLDAFEGPFDLLLALVLIWIGNRYRIKAPGLFALYVSIYCFGRFFEELLRIDPSHHFAGLRLNAWVSVVVFICSTTFFIWWQFLRGRRARKGPEAPKRPTMAVPKSRVR